MKRLIPILMALLLVGTACTTEPEAVDDIAEPAQDLAQAETTEEFDTALADLRDEAADLAVELSNADAAQLRTAFDALQTDLNTVATAAAGGEVSTEDLERLSGTLGDFEADLSQLSGELDDDLEAQLSQFQSQIQSILSQMMATS